MKQEVLEIIMNKSIVILQYAFSIMVLFMGLYENGIECLLMTSVLVAGTLSIMACNSFNLNKKWLHISIIGVLTIAIIANLIIIVKAIKIPDLAIKIVLLIYVLINALIVKANLYYFNKALKEGENL